MIVNCLQGSMFGYPLLQKLARELHLSVDFSPCELHNFQFTHSSCFPPIPVRKEAGVQDVPPVFELKLINNAFSAEGIV